MDAKSHFSIPLRNNGVRPGAGPESIRDTLRLIEESERPFIFAGAGINHTRATAELIELATLLDAPVVTSGLGKGGMPKDSPYSVGVFRSSVTQAAMEESDLLIAIGTRFTYHDTNNWSMKIRQPLLHIEADATKINRDYPATVGIGADAKVVLRQLNAELRGSEQSRAC